MSDATKHAAEWVTDPNDAEALENREIYAFAGLALHSAQCLEHEIVNSLGVFEIRRLLRAKWPRTDDEIREYHTEVDRVWDENFERTLGNLLRSLRESGVTIPVNIETELRKCLEARNRLVHRYFREQADKWFTSDGRKTMADDLKSMHELFHTADRALHEISSRIYSSAGITEEKINLISELMKAGASETEIEKALLNSREKTKHA